MCKPRAGNLVYQGAVGYQDRELRRPFEMDTIVRLMSQVSPEDGRCDASGTWFSVSIHTDVSPTYVNTDQACNSSWYHDVG